MIPLEDNVGDIIGKAQRGLGISDSELAERARIDSQTIRKLRDGDSDEAAILSVAPILGLSGSALCDLARGEWHPTKIEAIDGLEQFNSDYHEMAVNAYLVWDPASHAAAAFDTGADSREMVRFANRHKLNVQLILLTHAHPDHVADLPSLREETGGDVFAPTREAVPGAELIEEGKRFQLGNLKIDTRLTWGHSPGGMTYVVTGLAHPIAVVGDSLFAGSMGGGNASYQDALRNNLEKILTLSDDTIICPGHGPITTVGEEKVHNPFFAGKV
ncbi:MAG TPA: MBL fold metallo-hydrolase [Candidatus Udaeobacter sp.]|jgi:glyoxylase-like metal-dependent hydrolase (beta-lactamase superfamily II)|nr:MBL fold metallo-hydrolase [Candidatus Udaeobacter sp.]